MAAVAALAVMPYKIGSATLFIAAAEVGCAAATFAAKCRFWWSAHQGLLRCAGDP